jgi:hypothetical protein
MVRGLFLLIYYFAILDPHDQSADPAHLYSFIHQLVRLRVNRPPAPCSVSCSTFDLGCFRSLHTLKVRCTRWWCVAWRGVVGMEGCSGHGGV